MPDLLDAPRGPKPLVNVPNTQHIRVCTRCGMRYDWRKSPSSFLKMTYCGSLCERAELGFTVDALLSSERRQLGSDVSAVIAEAASR